MHLNFFYFYIFLFLCLIYNLLNCLYVFLLREQIPEPECQEICNVVAAQAPNEFKAAKTAELGKWKQCEVYQEVLDMVVGGGGGGGCDA